MTSGARVALGVNIPVPPVEDFVVIKCGIGEEDDLRRHRRHGAGTQVTPPPEKCQPRQEQPAGQQVSRRAPDEPSPIPQVRQMPETGEEEVLPVRIGPEEGQEGNRQDKNRVAGEYPPRPPEPGCRKQVGRYPQQPRQGEAFNRAETNRVRHPEDGDYPPEQPVGRRISSQHHQNPEDPDTSENPPESPERINLFFSPPLLSDNDKQTRYHQEDRGQSPQQVGVV